MPMTRQAASPASNIKMARALTMTYDANSRRTVLSDWTGLYTSTYDPDGRPSSVINPAGIAITYTYNALGQRPGWPSRPGRSLTCTILSEDQQTDEPRRAGDVLVIRRGQPRDRQHHGQYTQVSYTYDAPIASCCWQI